MPFYLINNFCGYGCINLMPDKLTTKCHEKTLDGVYIAVFHKSSNKRAITQ